MPEERSQIDVAAFAELARRVSRNLASVDSAAWIPQYERGMIAAHAQGDAAGLADMALFAAIRLDTEGRHREAIAQTEFALAFVDENTSSTALLQSMRAFYLVMEGDWSSAQEALKVAEPAAPRARPHRLRLESEVGCAVTRAIHLEASALEALRSLIRRVQRTSFDWQLSGLLSWFVPLLVAHGDPVGASPWQRALSALASSSEHPWRLADAAVFRLAIEHRNANGSGATRVEVGNNYIAGWRLGLFRLHHALRMRDPDAAERARNSLVALASKVHAGFLDGFDAIKAMGAGSGADDVAMSPPEAASLLNLEVVLAGTEYVAVHGDQASATAWMARLGSSLPREVRTSLAWPVARDRVEGLLRIRTGDVRGGVASLRAAIQWCDTAGYAVEGALSRLQLSEVMALSDRPTAKHRWTSMRAQAMEVLEQHGLDPVAPAYQATRAFSSGRGASAALLAPREVQVLKLLADGLTYREAAGELNVQWRTVQTHAYHAYAKLGVTRRLAAVEAARRLGII